MIQYISKHFLSEKDLFDRYLTLKISADKLIWVKIYKDKEMILNANIFCNKIWYIRHVMRQWNRIYSYLFESLTHCCSRFNLNFLLFKISSRNINYCIGIAIKDERTFNLLSTDKYETVFVCNTFLKRKLKRVFFKIYHKMYTQN